MINKQKTKNGYNQILWESEGALNYQYSFKLQINK